jgi:hypothetical protein
VPRHLEHTKLLLLATKAVLEGESRRRENIDCSKSCTLRPVNEWMLGYQWGSVK